MNVTTHDQLHIAESSTGVFHLYKYRRKSLCGNHRETERPVNQPVTAARVANNLCGNCRQIAKQNHQRELMRIYELADAAQGGA